MKKVLSLILVAGFTALIACGPSAEEKAATEKARQDSINNVMAQMAADSTAAAEKARQDSMEMAAAAEKARQDSMATAEAAKKKSGSKPKAQPKPAPAPTDPPKVGQKKPGAK